MENFSLFSREASALEGSFFTRMTFKWIILTGTIFTQVFFQLFPRFLNPRTTLSTHPRINANLFVGVNYVTLIPDQLCSPGKLRPATNFKRVTFRIVLQNHKGLYPLYPAQFCNNFLWIQVVNTSKVRFMLIA